MYIKYAGFQQKKIVQETVFRHCLDANFTGIWSQKFNHFFVLFYVQFPFIRYILFYPLILK